MTRYDIDWSLKPEDSVFMSKVKWGEGSFEAKDKVLVDVNSSKPRKAASLTKVFFALEVSRQLGTGELGKEAIDIPLDVINEFGTNVLGDMVGRGNVVKLEPLTLAGLMLKYSCNASTRIVLEKLLPVRKDLEEIARKEWGLREITLVDSQGRSENTISLRDMRRLYGVLFDADRGVRLNGEYLTYLREKLKLSRNIYYLFDQQEVKILGCKSGTLFEGGYYWIGDTGVFEVRGESYFIGAILRRRRISEAVIKIREIGFNMMEIARGKDVT